MVAHNGLHTLQGAEKDYRNDIGPVTRGNNKCIETFIPRYYALDKNCSIIICIIIIIIIIIKVYYIIIVVFQKHTTSRSFRPVLFL